MCFETSITACCWKEVEVQVTLGMHKTSVFYEFNPVLGVSVKYWFCHTFSLYCVLTGHSISPSLSAVLWPSCSWSESDTGAHAVYHELFSALHSPSSVSDREKLFTFPKILHMWNEEYLHFKMQSVIYSLAHQCSRGSWESLWPSTCFSCSICKIR